MPTTQITVLTTDAMEYISGALPVNGSVSTLRPHLFSTSGEFDDLQDLPDVGPVLERSGILDDSGSPNSLRGFDVGDDFGIGDGRDDLPFDEILEFHDAASSAVSQNLLIPMYDGKNCPAQPILAQLPPELVVPRPDLVLLGHSNPYSVNPSSAALHLSTHRGTVGQTASCNQPNFIRPNGEPKFVSSILYGCENSRKLASRGHGGRGRSTDVSGLTFQKDRSAPAEYKRVMDILTEYRIRVAEKSAEAMMPCKRRKSRPLVDTVEVAKSGGPTLHQSSALVAHQNESLVEKLRNAESIPSSSSTVNRPQSSTPGISFQNGHSIIDLNPVTGCALDNAVNPCSVVSQKLSFNNCIQSGDDPKLPKSLCTASSISLSTANCLQDKSCKNSAKKALDQVPPACHCPNAGR